MKRSFAETLLNARKQKGLSQQQLADRLFVNRSSVANWESGRRLPDATMISRIAEVLDVGISEMFTAADEDAAAPVVMVVDDERIMLGGALSVIRRAMPKAKTVGFTNPAEALAFCKEEKVSLVFLDIVMGNISGLDICREILGINPKTNVFYLTAYPEYSLDAWKTGACGFMVKPIAEPELREHLALLRYPIGGALR